MAELTFLAAMRDLLAATPLVPAVAVGRIGPLDPTATSELPSLVLSLDASTRVRIGIGERSEPMTGVLPVRASIDLARPMLPGDSTFSLVDPTRRNVTLPHGGLVRADGAEAIASLSAPDGQVRLDGASLPLVPGAPAAGTARIDPIAGLMQLGTPLPAAGILDIDYFLGQWERGVERVTGTLRLEACAASPADAAQLAEAAVTRLLAPAARAAQPAVRALTLTALSSAAPHASPPAPMAHARRTATFAFEFQRLIDRAESSGGIIRRIPITTRLAALRVDRETRAVVSDLFVESG